jgi:hypothetical protein
MIYETYTCFSIMLELKSCDGIGPESLLFPKWLQEVEIIWDNYLVKWDVSVEIENESRHTSASPNGACPNPIVLDH